IVKTLAIKRLASRLGHRSKGRTIWIADAPRDDGKRFIVHADEKLMAFLNWNQRFVLSANWFDRLAGFLPNSASPSGPESGGEQFPARFFAPSGSVKTSATTEGRSRRPNRTDCLGYRGQIL